MLEWTVQEGWGPLCAFLGREVPVVDGEVVEFPSGNTPGELFATARRVGARDVRRAWRNLGIVVGVGLGVVVGGLAVYLRRR